MPFVYEATGVITRFTDQRDPKPRSREVFSFHRPETLRTALRTRSLRTRSLRARLHDLPALDPTGLRACQIDAITNLEASLKAAKPRALVQMATGSGKTFTAITSIYRLLKFARIRRVLFLVDTRNLGEQAEQEFLAFTPGDDNRKFTELYTVTRLASSHLPTDAEVYISTIQRMYSLLQGDPLDPSAEMRQRPPNRRLARRASAVCARQYTHERAVADGVNVQGEIYVIETDVSKNGGTVLKGLIEKREKLTRARRWQQQDQDEAYSAKKLDRDIVNPSQLRTAIRTFRDKLPEIFPDRRDAAGAFEVPKTLIFAKTDSHADDIINLVREVQPVSRRASTCAARPKGRGVLARSDAFGEGNAFCKKVTFGSGQGVKKIAFKPGTDERVVADDYVMPPEAPKSVLSQFRNGYSPLTAVTVDMIATGTGVNRSSHQPKLC